jgi:phosphopantothenoylcysteine decarboxylase/phosphopantothenate--cysteine ligase
MLKGKRVLLGVTGSIAAYKSAILVRALIKEGAEVKVLMTPAASDFITPLTLSTLSKNDVITGLFEAGTWANHVLLGRWADIMVIAPLTCNTLSKMATGACDNLLMAVYLSATCPVVVAPAMDEDMWKHRTVKENLKKITEAGNEVIPVNSGELASGLFGEGRMAEPEEILAFIKERLTPLTALSGKNVLVTAGPTFEAIDPVRFVGNHSSGKMGVEIAKALQSKGANVHLVLGPVSGSFDLTGLDVKRVESANDMYEACLKNFQSADIAVMAAAVADYSPVEKAENKIKKTGEEWNLSFKKTPDILKSLGALKSSKQFLVGFALETNNERENAIAKLKNKNADLIVLNSLRETGAGFGFDTNKVTVFNNKGDEFAFEMKSKKEVANDLVELIINEMHA